LIADDGAEHDEKERDRGDNPEPAYGHD
jgi:hypothetical protein